MTKVKEIMNTDIMPVLPDDTIPEIARKISSSNLNLIPVCENGRFEGIITDSKIITTMAQVNGDFKRIQAESLMERDIPKILEGIDVVEAAKIMTSHGIRHVPVIRKGNQFAGILTIDNLVEESLALASMVLAAKTRQND